MGPIAEGLPVGGGGVDATQAEPTKIPYPDRLFVTKDDALRVKAAIDRENFRRAQGGPGHPVDQCTTKCATDNVLTPYGETSERLRDFYRIRLDYLRAQRRDFEQSIKATERMMQRIHQHMDDLGL